MYTIEISLVNAGIFPPVQGLEDTECSRNEVSIQKYFFEIYREIADSELSRVHCLCISSIYANYLMISLSTLLKSTLLYKANKGILRNLRVPITKDKTSSQCSQDIKPELQVNKLIQRGRKKIQKPIGPTKSSHLSV